MPFFGAFSWSFSWSFLDHFFTLSMSGFTSPIRLLSTNKAFISLSLALLVDKKAQSPVSYFTHATIASLAVGLGSIYVSNLVGVYI